MQTRMTGIIRVGGVVRIGIMMLVTKTGQLYGPCLCPFMGLQASGIRLHASCGCSKIPRNSHFKAALSEAKSNPSLPEHLEKVPLVSKI